jgi:hypothetical protein
VVDDEEEDAFMGKVYRPEDLTADRPKQVPDLPIRSPTPLVRADIESLYREVESIRREIDKIKQALRTHGIAVE